MTRSGGWSVGVRLAIKWAVPPLTVILLVVLAFQVLVPVFRVPQFIIPLPSSVVSLLLFSKVPWSQHVLATTTEAVYGFMLAAVVGVAIAVAISVSGVLKAIFEPLILSVQIIPKVAIVPILFLWLGLGLLPKVITVFLMCLFPIVIDTEAGLASADRDMIDLVRTFDPSRVTILRKAMLPSALPSIFSGLKVAIALALVGAVVAEFVSSSQGLGFLILSAQVQLDTTLAFASATLLALVGFALYAAILVAERIALPWRQK